MVAALTENGQKQDTEAGTAVYTEREEKYRDARGNGGGTDFNWRVKEQTLCLNLQS